MTPIEAVADYVQRQAGVKRFCVAYSGGMDSHVLLALLVQLQQENPSLEIRAVHIDHGIQDGSEKWAEHAKAVCAGFEKLPQGEYAMRSFLHFCKLRSICCWLSMPRIKLKHFCCKP